MSKNWDKFLEDVKKLIGNLPKHSKSAGNEYYEEPLELAGWDGDGKPEFSGDEIRFNGVNNNDMSHESFVIEKIFQSSKGRLPPKENGMCSAFCKTARKPYDLAVCCVLLLARKNFGDEFVIFSDGGDYLTSEDWKPARDLIIELGFGDFLMIENI